MPAPAGDVLDRQALEKVIAAITDRTGSVMDRFRRPHRLLREPADAVLQTFPIIRVLSRRGKRNGDESTWHRVEQLVVGARKLDECRLIPADMEGGRKKNYVVPARIRERL